MEEESVLSISHLNSWYGHGKTRKQVLKDVSLFLKSGETLGIVGESGSGKTTLCNAILGFVPDYDGKIILNAKNPQMVFQDPYSSLNPAKTIGWILEEPLKAIKVKNKNERRLRVLKMLELVGLSKEHSDRKPSQLSGGERQRVSIASALIQGSKFVVLDEPVSALDVTLQAQILQLLVNLKEQLGLSYLFISHDLLVVYELCDRVCVMRRGAIVEEGDVDSVYDHPRHDYTQKLLTASSALNGS